MVRQTKSRKIPTRKILPLVVVIRYWPGSGVVCNEHDLLEVGDDAVFGSRSTVITCDAKEAATVSIGAGCFVADRCVLLPGTTLETNALLGSGGLGAKHFTAKPGSQHVGSTGRKALQLSPGNAAAAQEPTLRPFGKAFYRHGGFKAPYYVLREWMVILMHHLWYAASA